jgi:hypothetical protein
VPKAIEAVWKIQSTRLIAGAPTQRTSPRQLSLCCRGFPLYLASRVVQANGARIVIISLRIDE